MAIKRENMLWREKLDQSVIHKGLQVVRLGGAVLKRNFGKVHTISYKGRLDLVTETDQRSEKVMVEFLKQQFPGCGILAEEQKEIQAESAFRWILDPLDGTTNYVHGYPFFSVSLALEFAGTVVWGAVYDPMREEMFTAVEGEGASLNGRTISVSSVDRLLRALFLVLRAKAAEAHRG